MKLQAEAISQFVGKKDYTIDGMSIVIGSNKFALTRYDSNFHYFRIPAKFQHSLIDKLEQFIIETSETLNGFFEDLDSSSFLRNFTKNTYIVVSSDNKVSLKSVFSKKSKSVFKLNIPLFGEDRINNVNFSIITLNDVFIITTDFDKKESNNLKHLYLLSNFRYQIKEMLGSTDDIERCSHLLDMYFV